MAFISVQTESNYHANTEWWYPSDLTQSGFPMIVLLIIQVIKQFKIKKFKISILLETGIASFLFMITSGQHLFLNRTRVLGTLHILFVTAVVVRRLFFKNRQVHTCLTEKSSD